MCVCVRVNNNNSGLVLFTALEQSLSLTLSLSLMRLVLRCILHWQDVWIARDRTPIVYCGETPLLLPLFYSLSLLQLGIRQALSLSRSHSVALCATRRH